MSTNYAKAALRHYNDAEKLASARSLDGAAHLVGFAAECAVKYGIEALRPSSHAPHLHFPQLINAAKRHLSGRNRHALFTLLHTRNFMAGWSIDHRYADDGTIDQRRYDTWRAQARRAIGAAQIRSY